MDLALDLGLGGNPRERQIPRRWRRVERRGRLARQGSEEALSFVRFSAPSLPETAQTPWDSEPFPAFDGEGPTDPEASQGP
jgi:hypothetical protein